MFVAWIRQVAWSLVIVRPTVPQDAPTGGGGVTCVVAVVETVGEGGAGVAVVDVVVVVGAVVVVGVVVVVGGVVVVVGVVRVGGVGAVVVVVVVGGGGPGGAPPKPWFGGGTKFPFLGGVPRGGVPSPATGRPPLSGGVLAVDPPTAAKLVTLPLAACASCGIWLVAVCPTRFRPPLDAARAPIVADAKPPRSSCEL
jgi:hypothetical protein